MIAFDLEATVESVLQALQQRHGERFVPPTGRPPHRLGTRPCLIKLAGLAVNVEKLMEAANTSRRLGPTPSWGDVACFMGEEIPGCLAHDEDKFQCSGNQHICHGACPYDKSDTDMFHA